MAEENTELTQTARLAQVFNSVCRQVMEYKGKSKAPLDRTVKLAVKYPPTIVNIQMCFIYSWIWGLKTCSKGDKIVVICCLWILDKEGRDPVSTLALPSKKKHPEYYTVIENPTDFQIIEKNIFSGAYADLEAFDKDMNTLFKNAEVGWLNLTRHVELAPQSHFDSRNKCYVYLEITSHCCCVLLLWDFVM